MSAQPLSRGRIVEEAIALLDEEGPDSLSMRRLGSRLGVSTMSTYHHFSDKAALVDAIAERVMAELADPPADDDWRDALRQLAVSFRGLTRRHPSVFRALMAGERPPAMVRTVDAVVDRLMAAGFDTAAATAVVRTVVRYLLGGMMIEAYAPLEPAELDRAFLDGLDVLLLGAEVRFADRRR